VSTSLMTVIMLYLHGVPAVYKTMFTIPNIVVMNMMACRVFRNTRLGDFKGSLIVNSNNMLSREGRNKRNGPCVTATIPLGPMQFRDGEEKTKTNQSTMSTELSTLSERHTDEKSAFGSQGHGGLA